MKIKLQLFPSALSKYSEFLLLTLHEFTPRKYHDQKQTFSCTHGAHSCIGEQINPHPKGDVTANCDYVLWREKRRGLWKRRKVKSCFIWTGRMPLEGASRVRRTSQEEDERPSELWHGGLCHSLPTEQEVHGHSDL